MNDIGTPLTNWQKATLEHKREALLLNGYSYRLQMGPGTSCERTRRVSGAVRDIDWMQHLEYVSKL